MRLILPLQQLKTNVNKTQKYNIISGVDFVSMIIKTSVVWGRQGHDLVDEIGRLNAAVTSKHLGDGEAWNAFGVLKTFKLGHHIECIQ